ncbi:MAG: hypothetical protein U0939_19495 [Pirellulales bacterium]
MAIPSRFRVKSPTKKAMLELRRLAQQIERALERQEDAAPLLAQWNEQACREYAPSEFQTYWKSTDLDAFVREALCPSPRKVDDLKYREALAVLKAMLEEGLTSAKQTYYLEWLEVQFPGANMSDLIYWPDEWFDDPSYVRNPDGSFNPDAQLTLDQLLAYAQAKSGRQLRGAPADVPLPFPLPRTS